MRRCRAPAGRRRWRPRRRTSGRRCPGIRRSAWGYVSSWSPSPVLAVRAYDEVAMSASANTIDTLLEERRSVPPSDEFRRRARVTDDSLHRAAAADPEAFWAEQALRYITWFQPWERVLDWELPFARWFVGGKLNVAFNCLDRHVDAGRGDKVAYHWEGEPGDTRTITYAELLAEVCKFANALRALGVRRGDRVGIYLPMIPELPVAMLACANRSTWTRKTCCSRCTRRGRRPGRRGSSTRPPGISCTGCLRTTSSSTSSRTPCTGALPMSAGSRDTRTSCTHRWATA